MAGPTVTKRKGNLAQGDYDKLVESHLKQKAEAADSKGPTLKAAWKDVSHCSDPIPADLLSDRFGPAV